MFRHMHQVGMSIGGFFIEPEGAQTEWGCIVWAGMFLSKNW